MGAILNTSWKCCAVCAAVLLALTLSCKTLAGELKTGSEIVIVRGVLTREKYFNPNKEVDEWVFILTLSAPVDVGRDEFGEEEKGVQKLQLIFFPEVLSYDSVKTNYLGKAVEVSGTLFRQITVHHYTPVLLRAKTIVAISKDEK